MTDLTRDFPANGPMITGFAGNAFKIGPLLFPRGLLLTPLSAADWDAPLLDALTQADLAPLLELLPPPEFLLLGTGAVLVQPPRAFVRDIEALGLGVEAMDSKAAARTWGVLRQEDRWIVGALLSI